MEGAVCAVKVANSKNVSNQGQPKTAALRFIGPKREPPPRGKPKPTNLLSASKLTIITPAAGKTARPTRPQVGKQPGNYTIHTLAYCAIARSLISLQRVGCGIGALVVECPCLNAVTSVVVSTSSLQVPSNMHVFLAVPEAD